MCCLVHVRLNEYVLFFYYEHAYKLVILWMESYMGVGQNSTTRNRRF